LKGDSGGMKHTIGVDDALADFEHTLIAGRWEPSRNYEISPAQ
jgi:hypothetical protein